MIFLGGPMFRTALLAYWALITVVGGGPCCCCASRIASVFSFGAIQASPTCCCLPSADSEQQSDQGCPDRPQNHDCQCVKAYCGTQPIEFVAPPVQDDGFGASLDACLIVFSTVNPDTTGFTLTRWSAELKPLHGRLLRIAHCSWRC